MTDPAPGEVWLVQRHEVDHEPAQLAQYYEDDDGDGTWHYFGTDWFDRAAPTQAGDVRVVPIRLIWRGEV